MYTTVGRLSSYISQGVYTFSGPFHPFGGAVDIIVVQQQDGTFKSTPWYVKFGKFQGVLKRTEKIVTVAVDDVDANFHMYLDHKGEAYFLEDVSDREKNAFSPPSGPSSGDEALEPLALEYHKTEEGQEGHKDQHSGSKDDSSDDGEDDVEVTSRRWADEEKLQNTYSEELDKVTEDSQFLLEDTSVSRTASKETSKIQELLNEAVGIRDAGKLGPARAFIANSALISIERVAESGDSLQMENADVNITEKSSILEVYEESEFSASHMAETSLSSETGDLAISTSDVAASVVADFVDDGYSVKETGNANKSEDLQIEISELERQVLSAEMTSTQEAPLAIGDECSTSLQVKVSAEQEIAWTDVVIKAAAALQEAPIAYSPSKQNSNLKENSEKRTWGWWVWRGGGSNQPKQGSDSRIDSKKMSVKERSSVAKEHIENSFEDTSESMVIPVQEHDLEKEVPELKSKVLKPGRSILGLMFGVSRPAQDDHGGKVNKANSSLESAESVVELLENKWTIGNGATIGNSVKSMHRVGLKGNQVDARNGEPLRGPNLEVNCVEVSQLEGSGSSSQASINGNHKMRNGMSITGNVDLSNAEVVLMSVDGHLVVAKQDECSLQEPKQSIIESSVGDQSKEAFESYISVGLEVKGGNIHDLESSGDTVAASIDYGGHVVCKMQLHNKKKASTSAHKKAQRSLLAFDDHNTVGNGGKRSGTFTDVENDVFKSCLALPDLSSAASEDEEDVDHEIIEPDRKKGYGNPGENLDSATTAPINVPGKRFMGMTDTMDMKVGSESILDPPGHRTDFGRLSNSLSSYFHVKKEKTSSIENASTMDVQVESPWSTVSDPETTMIDMLKDEVVERQSSASEVGTFEKAKTAPLAGFELSLCRHLITEGMGVEAAAQVFDANKITLELFKSSGSLAGNEALVVRVGGRYYPSAVAASILFGLLAFGQVIIPENGEPIKVEAPETVTDIIPKDTSSTLSGAWKFWPFALRRPKTPDLTQAASREALLVATQAAQHNSLATGLKRRNGHYRRASLIPTSEQLASLKLKEGRNKITFTFTTRVLGKQQVDARIYLWKWNTKIVISDVDGTITKSDVLGQVMPLVGKDWTQTGVTRLFSAIKDNGYQLMFLSARAISQAYLTRQFLVNLKQDGEALPDGPVVISPDGLFPSLYREVIRRAPHEFKIACLEDIKSLFPSECQPFYAGFGNRDTDEISYLKVGIPKGKIFIINPKGEVIVNNILDLKSYTSLHKLVNDMFPPVAFTEREDFNSWNFWKMPLPDVDDL